MTTKTDREYPEGLKAGSVTDTKAIRHQLRAYLGDLKIILEDEGNVSQVPTDKFCADLASYIENAIIPDYAAERSRVDQIELIDRLFDKYAAAGSSRSWYDIITAEKARLQPTEESTHE